MTSSSRSRSARTPTCRSRKNVPPTPVVSLLLPALVLVLVLIVGRPDPASSLLSPAGSRAALFRPHVGWAGAVTGSLLRGWPGDEFTRRRRRGERSDEQGVVVASSPLRATNPTGRGGGEEAQLDEAWDMSLIEREVHDSAREKMDWRTVRGAVGLDSSVAPSAKAAKDETSKSGGGRWDVALYSGAACCLLSYLLFHSYVFSAVVAGAAVFVASGDPLEEEGAAGAAARIIGRTTIQTVEASKPKVRAVARAAVGGTDSEWQALESRVAELEGENAALRLQVERLTAARNYQERYVRNRGVMPSNSNPPVGTGTGSGTTGIIGTSSSSPRMPSNSNPGGTAAAPRPPPPPPSRNYQEQYERYRGDVVPSNPPPPGGTSSARSGTTGGIGGASSSSPPRTSTRPPVGGGTTAPPRPPPPPPGGVGLRKPKSFPPDVFK